VPGVGRPGDALRAVAVRAQPLDPDPPLDHAQHIAARIVRLQDHAGEVDERPHRGLVSRRARRSSSSRLRCAVWSAAASARS
jgi:hypothetical protein